jgi:hypothetical protein
MTGVMKRNNASIERDIDVTGANPMPLHRSVISATPMRATPALTAGALTVPAAYSLGK